MLRAIKIRLYPNTTQATQINKLLGCYRFVYNQCLARKINSYKENKVSENLSTLGQFVHHELLKDDNFIWLREQNTKVLKQAVIDMLDAYKNFFEKHTGYPKFKSKKDNKQSCRFELGTISKRNVYTDYKLSLANIKNIKFRCSKKYAEYLQKHKANIRQATLTKLPCGEYYLSILVDGDLTHKVKESHNIIGIDLGIKDLIITSNGEKFENKQFYRKQENKLKILNRKFAKTQNGSNNHQKIRVKIAKLNDKIRNQRLWYIHHIVNQLLNENQVIVMEDLNVSGMMKNHKLAKSIQDVSFCELKQILQYKASWNDKQIVFIDRFYPSSKLCYDCGYKNDSLQLSDREWVCPNCGVVHDRDINAAKNILEEGKRIIGLSSPEFTLVDYPTMDDRLGNKELKSSDRMKQEKNVFH